jgi:hypothetical protein
MYPMSLPYLGPAALATMVVGLYTVPCGFLAAHIANVAGSRNGTLAEKLAWSAALAYPVSAMVTVLTDHFLGARSTQAALLAIMLVACILAVRTLRPAQLRGLVPMWPLGLVLLGTALWCFIATVPVLVRGHLEEGVFTNDWYIRVPLQYAATTGIVPPFNPLYTLAGANPPLHYYYFFSALLAPPMRMAGFDSRSALIAGTVWAGIAFFAAAWLLLKYLVIPAERARRQTVAPALRLQSQALIFVAISLIAGLDLVPNLGALAMGGRLFPTLFFWSGEAVSTWPGILPFVPHHIVGLTTAFCGYLLLVLNAQHGPLVPKRPPLAKAIGAALVGLCFAAAIGTSTFIGLTVLLAVAALSIDGLLHRSWRTAAVAAAAVTLALAMDAALLLDFPHRTAAITSFEPAGPFPLKLVLRNWHQAYGLTGALMARVLHAVQPHGMRAYLGAIPTLVGLYAIDLGFFWIVLWYRFRRPAPGGPVQRIETERALLWLFLSCAFVSVFISSAPMQHGLNDLGRHTAIGAHFVLMLWACPMVADAWHQWRAGTLSRTTRRLYLFAATLAVAGWLGTAWDVGVQRLYLPLVDRGSIQARKPFILSTNAGLHYEELREAWEVIATSTPPEAIIQDNPDGALQRPFLLYLNRRVATGDVSCETPFGGQLASCLAQNVLPLLSLFEQNEDQTDLQVPFDSSPGAFSATCRALHLSALLVTDSDPVWRKPDSWVWQSPVLYAGNFVRVVACPVPAPHAGP